MTPRGSPRPRSCPRKVRPTAPASCSERSPGSAAAASPSSGTRPTRQRLSLQALRQRLGRGRRQTRAHPALSAPHQRQGRALHPDQPQRMGLRARLFAPQTKAPPPSDPGSSGSRHSFVALPNVPTLPHWIVTRPPRWLLTSFAAGHDRLSHSGVLVGQRHGRDLRDPSSSAARSGVAKPLCPST